MKYEVHKNESLDDGNITWAIVRSDHSIVRPFDDKREAEEIAKEFNEAYN